MLFRVTRMSSGPNDEWPTPGVEYLVEAESIEEVESSIPIGFLVWHDVEEVESLTPEGLTKAIAEDRAEREYRRMGYG